MLNLTKSEQRVLIIISFVLLASAVVQWLRPHNVNADLFDYTMQDSLFKTISAESSYDSVKTTDPEFQNNSVQKPYKKKAGIPPNSININTASGKELEKLPNIGPVIAGRIIDYRKTKGSFKSVDALVNVKGIGKKTMAKIKPYIFVEQTK